MTYSSCSSDVQRTVAAQPLIVQPVLSVLLGTDDTFFQIDQVIFRTVASPTQCGAFLRRLFHRLLTTLFLNTRLLASSAPLMFKPALDVPKGVRAPCLVTFNRPFPDPGRSISDRIKQPRLTSLPLLLGRASRTPGTRIPIGSDPGIPVEEQAGSHFC
ncbi:MAG: hypothetical protein CBC35_05330 [Planctomycetes bacterium TMED75]|nr:hypothetical protein [Planctomycetaceae bacterium]OUU93575.1 MAG: hypothetical protein CBC35_05330 [Planctomycetes bacterium TMED75]